MGNKHNFIYNTKLFKYWECTKCKRYSIINGINLNQIKKRYLGQDTYSYGGRAKDSIRYKKCCKSSYKLIKERHYYKPSGSTAVIKNQKLYLINPYSGKILTKIDCEYSSAEILMKEIL